MIVGGGLAGASAACILADAGRPTLLIERDPEPRHKVCGEFLSIEAQTYLADLSLDLDRLGASRISRIRLAHGRAHDRGGAALSRPRAVAQGPGRSPAAESAIPGSQDRTAASR